MAAAAGGPGTPEPAAPKASAGTVIEAMAKSRELTLTESFVLSGIAGVMSRVSCYPLDTIRARLQVQGMANAAVGIGSGYRGVVHAAAAIMRTEGLRGLFRGVTMATVVSVPGTAAYLTVYNKVKAAAATGLGVADHNPVVVLTSAVLAEAVSGVIWTPMDVIKQRLQVQTAAAGAGGGRAAYRNSWHAARTILATEGVAGLYRGYFALLWLFGPFSLAFFLCYEQLKHFGMGSISRRGDAAFTQYLVFSGTSAAIAAALTNPLDVAKTRIQVQLAAAATGQSGGRSYRNVADALGRIVREEGPAALFRGLRARVLWAAPGTAVTISVFEWLREWITWDGWILGSS